MSVKKKYHFLKRASFKGQKDVAGSQLFLSNLNLNPTLKQSFEEKVKTFVPLPQDSRRLRRRPGSPCGDRWCLPRRKPMETRLP
ncbi:Hypothetical protein SMAX5B_014745 [Scophthalmus maximus]|uniref:Uncharacterized protein n=1 Tax=Scophthalmus maximus TaxID=52904 RepID=A0A2U9C094_SCOMX|nr:Hypothetical protein SMAX5B_014745 [Scophthalmus maximus]